MREEEGEQAHSPGRAKRNFTQIWSYKQDDEWVRKTGGKGGWEAAKVATLLFCQVCSALWKTTTFPSSTQSSIQLPFWGSSGLRTGAPCLGRGVPRKLAFRTMWYWSHLWYALGKWVECLVKYTTGLSVCIPECSVDTCAHLDLGAACLVF